MSSKNSNSEFMQRKWFKTDFRLALFILILVVLAVLLFDKSSYTEDEIEWCNAELPHLPINICARQFGY